MERHDLSDVRSSLQVKNFKLCKVLDVCFVCNRVRSRQTLLAVISILVAVLYSRLKRRSAAFVVHELLLKQTTGNYSWGELTYLLHVVIIGATLTSRDTTDRGRHHPPVSLELCTSSCSRRSRGLSARYDMLVLMLRVSQP